MTRDGPRIRVLGAGSIGARHARNLIALGASVEVSDADWSRAAAIPGAVPVANEFSNLGGYDGIVVATPTANHVEHTLLAIRARRPVLVEKPMAASGIGVADILAEPAAQIMVGYNLRFHDPVVRFVELAQSGRAGRILSVRAWFGSWLPDWRPAVDYRGTYSAHRRQGGGVLLDAIHELDLLVWLLGDDLAVVGALVERLGPLEVDCEDTVKALLRAPDGTPAELSLDYLSRSYRRGLEVIGDQATLRLDWAAGALTIEGPGEQATTEMMTVPVDLSYQREAECFVGWLSGTAQPPVDAQVGAASVGLADRIRAKAAG